MPRGGIDIGPDQRKLLLMLAYDPHNNLSNMYADLDIQILILLSTPFKHLSLVQHLLGHPPQSLYFIPSHHLVLHLAFYFFDAGCCHIGIAYCFYLLDGKTRA